MKKSLLLIIVLFQYFNLFSQSPNQSSNSEVKEKDFGITINYFGELGSHSGIEIGMESAIFRLMRMSYHVGFYFVKEDQTDIALYWDLGYRKYFKSGYSPEAKIGIGYLTTYIPENAEGSEELLEVVYMPSVTLGLLGFDLRKTNNIPIRLFGNAMYYWKKPVGKSAKGVAAIQVGATYFFK